MRVIQVGMGGMGDAWLRTVLATGGRVAFAGFVEVNPEIAREQAQHYRLDADTIFSTLEVALHSVQADAVINVTPPQFHREISCLAMEAGLAVLSEKPLAGTRADAQAIVDTANRTGKLHMVAQNYRFHRPTYTLKQLLASGQLGAVGAVTVEFFKGPHFGGFRDEMAYPLIIDMAIHHFDLMRYFLDCNPLEVSGRSWNPPWSWYQGDASVAVALLFENGVPVMYQASWCANGQETPWNAHWRFDCEKGVVTLRGDQVYLQLLQGVEDKPGYRHNLYEPLTAVPLAEMPHEAQAYLLEAFYAAVKHGQPVPTPCQDNIHSLNIVFDLVERFEAMKPSRG